MKKLTILREYEPNNHFLDRKKNVDITNVFKKTMYCQRKTIDHLLPFQLLQYEHLMFSLLKTAQYNIK